MINKTFNIITSSRNTQVNKNYFLLTPEPYFNSCQNIPDIISICGKNQRIMKNQELILKPKKVHYKQSGRNEKSSIKQNITNLKINKDFHNKQQKSKIFFSELCSFRQLQSSQEEDFPLNEQNQNQQNRQGGNKIIKKLIKSQVNFIWKNQQQQQQFLDNPKIHHYKSQKKAVEFSKCLPQLLTTSVFLASKARLTIDPISMSQIPELTAFQTIKSLMTCKSLNTLKSNSSCSMVGQKIQLLSKGLNHILWKIKLEGYNKYIVKKIKKQKDMLKSQQLQILNLLSGSKFIVNLYEAYTIKLHKGQFFEFLMQYFPERDLKNKIYSEGAIQLNRVKIYAYQIFRGLHVIHHNKILHRNIQSDSILVKGNRLVIGGIGHAKIKKQNYPNSCLVGGSSEKAPELILNNKFYTQKIDIWAAGCVIVEMILGRKLFCQNSSTQNLLIQIIRILGSPTLQDLSSLSPNFEQIIKNWKLPLNVRPKPWYDILEQTNLDIKLVDFLSKIFKYDPTQRLSAVEALNHQYFDEIRDKQNYEKLRHKYRVKDLFTFLPNQMPQNEIILIPDWAKNYNKQKQQKKINSLHKF